MPLVTDNIEEARVAYNALEGRAQSAEQLAQTLQSALTNEIAREPVTFRVSEILRQHTLDREADNAQLTSQLQQALVVKADLPLQSFIASIGLASALGEATMPDRSISSVAATLQTHLQLAESVIGLRFFQPGIDRDSATLCTTTVQLAKVTPQPGVPAPRNLYTALEDKQSVYANAFWSKFVTTPPSQPAADAEAAIALLLANAGVWTFANVLQATIAIATLEKSLSVLVSAAQPGTAATSFASAVNDLFVLTASLQITALPVAGDLLALTAALDNVTSAARALLP